MNHLVNYAYTDEQRLAAAQQILLRGFPSDGFSSGYY